jgi:hypothetical protein
MKCTTPPFIQKKKASNDKQLAFRFWQTSKDAHQG